MSLRMVAAALSTLCLAAAAAAWAAPNIPAYITAAVADPNRPEADTKRDAVRKPAEMLEFAGVKQGQTVVDLIPLRWSLSPASSRATR